LKHIPRQSRYMLVQSKNVSRRLRHLSRQPRYMLVQSKHIPRQSRHMPVQLRRVSVQLRYTSRHLKKVKYLVTEFVQRRFTSPKRNSKAERVSSVFLLTLGGNAGLWHVITGPGPDSEAFIGEVHADFSERAVEAAVIGPIADLILGAQFLADVQETAGKIVNFEG